MKNRYLKWNKPKREKPTFYKGQKVIVLCNTCGHGFKLGQIVTLTSAVRYGRIWWELEAQGQGTSRFYMHDDICKPYYGRKK